MDTRNPLLLPDLFHTVLDHLFEYHPKEHRPKDYHPPPPVREEDDKYDQCLLDEDGRVALLALAQTCRDVSKLSLDRLWRDLGSLKPLIRCYGGDPTLEYPDEMELTPPTSDELNIIRRYSPRIRTLYLRDCPSMLLLRYIGLQSSSFFPNLTCLLYDETHPRRYGIPTVPIATLACLLTPELTSLEVVFAKRVDGVQAFLQDLHQICPNLRTFKFEARPNKRKQNNPLQILHHIPDLSRFNNLQYASLQAFIDHITFENLSLSSLPRRFSAAVRRNQSTPLETSLGPADIPFRHAKHVSLRVWDLDFVTNLLRPSDQAFDSIDVSIEEGDRPAPSSVDAFFKALGSATYAGSLRTIQLTQPQTRLGQLLPGSLSSDLPSLLTSFCRLETLVIDLGNISIDDSQLAKLGCLQSLQVLKLTCWRASHPLVQLPTLRGVLSLVESCQQLQKLALPVDAMQVPEAVDATIRNTTLTTLMFVDSPIDDPTRVAQFISKHLPSVKRVRPARSQSVESYIWYRYWDRWLNVHFKVSGGVDDADDPWF